MSNSDSHTTKGIFFTDEQATKLASEIHYPEHWDTATYPALADAIYEIVTNAGCSECRAEAEANYVLGI